MILKSLIGWRFDVNMVTVINWSNELKELSIFNYQLFKSIINNSECYPERLIQDYLRSRTDHIPVGQHINSAGAFPLSTLNISLQPTAVTHRQVEQYRAAGK